jgi:alkylated DNA repair protein (DNA oxidative demethylase)
VAWIKTIGEIAAAAPFRNMSTPGGRQMSVAMTNCGAAGWITDRRGYRYAATDPLTGNGWPEMPDAFLALAKMAAAAGGFADFVPDSCLINRYTPGAKMTLHRDADERDFAAPIVSVSLGLPAVFLWGGATRAEQAARIPVENGDVLVWGGAARLNFHGILPLREGAQAQRFNLTFRKAF